jgi:hypothetical protein
MSMINAHRQEDSKLEFSFLMWLAFAVFFVAIAMTRLMPRSMRPRVGGHDDGKSIFAAAKAATYNSIPFAFM